LNRVVIEGLKDPEGMVRSVNQTMINASFVYY